MRQLKPPLWRFRPPAGVNPQVSNFIFAFLAESGSVPLILSSVEKNWESCFSECLDGLAVPCLTWADWIDRFSPRHPNPAMYNKYGSPLSSLVPCLQKPAIFSESLASSSASPPTCSLTCLLSVWREAEDTQHVTSVSNYLNRFNDRRTTAYSKLKETVCDERMNDTFDTIPIF